MVRSTGKVPAPGFGLASEPIARWGESAPNSLLAAAPVGGLFPPPYPPPPQAARPSAEDSIAETTSSLRFGIMLLLSAKAGIYVNSAGGSTLPRADGCSAREYKPSLIHNAPRSALVTKRKCADSAKFGIFPRSFCLHVTARETILLCRRHSQRYEGRCS